MNIREYEALVQETNHWPEDKKGDRVLLTVALAGEVGEYANLLKKHTLGKRGSTNELIDELGDVLWYLTTLTHSHHISLKTLMKENAKKVTSRSKNKEHYSQC